jgi:hypothetical protein
MLTACYQTRDGVDRSWGLRATPSRAAVKVGRPRPLSRPIPFNQYPAARAAESPLLSSSKGACA